MVFDLVYVFLKVVIFFFDVYIGLLFFDNGEIRYYNYGEQVVVGIVYLFSIDYGLIWKWVNCFKEMFFVDCQSFVSKEYICLVDMGVMGVYCICIFGGLIGGCIFMKVVDCNFIMIKLFVFI